MLVTIPSSNQKKMKWVAAGRPQLILAEGDSWFEYPVLPSNGGLGANFDLLWQLHELGEWIAPLSNAGDCISEMVDKIQFAQSKKMIKGLKDNGYKVKGVVVSGGGNDMTGKHLRTILVKAPGGTQLKDFINQDAWDTKFLEIETHYRSFIDFCREHVNRNIKILGHTYDYAFATGKMYKAFGVVDYLGPWILPFFNEMEMPVSLHQAMVKKMIDRFVAVLTTLKADYPANFDFVDLRETLTSIDEWVNELHPTGEGFERLGTVFYKKTKAFFG